MTDLNLAAAFWLVLGVVRSAGAFVAIVAMLWPRRDKRKRRK